MKFLPTEPPYREPEDSIAGIFKKHFDYKKPSSDSLPEDMQDLAKLQDLYFSGKNLENIRNRGMRQNLYWAFSDKIDARTRNSIREVRWATEVSNNPNPLYDGAEEYDKDISDYKVKVFKDGEPIE